MNKTIVDTAREFAFKCHTETNHTYDGMPYSVHLKMAERWADTFIHLVAYNDRPTVMSGVICHDTIEDTRISWNELRKAVGSEVADIVYALTNEKGKNRAERANSKYYKGIRSNPYAVFGKLCDRLANAEYSFGKWLKDRNSGSMYEKYQAENEKFIWNLVKPEWFEVSEWLLKLCYGRKKYIACAIERHEYKEMFNELISILKK